MPSNAMNLAIEITAKDSTAGALSKTRAGLQSISDQLAAAKAQFIAFHASMLSLGRIRALAEMADQIALVNARLRLAVDGAREFAQAQQLAYRVAAQTGAGYEAVATLYGRLAQTAKGFGLTQEAVAQTTEATALALKVSGASAAEAAAVVRQFSQALGSGVLRGDEFNSIMENGGRLAQALADGLGLPVGELRNLAEQGLLTTDVIVKALLPQLDQLRQEAGAMPKTIGAAASEMKDAFGRVVDEFNRATGATSGMANAISSLARNMDAVLGGAAVAAAGAMAAALARGGQAAAGAIAQLMAKIAADRQAAISAQAVAANEVAKAQAMLASAQAAVAAASGMARLSIVQTQLVPAQQRLAAAQAALNTAMATGGVVARGLTAALGLVGGPLGAILTLLTMGATAWAIWGDKAHTAADKARASAESAREALARLEREKKYGTGDAATFREEIARLEARKAALEESARVAYRGRPTDALKNELVSVEADLKRYRAALADVEAKEKSLAGDAYDTFGLKRRAIEQFVDGFRAKIDPLKAALDELKKKFQDAKLPLDSKEYREAEALIRSAFAKKAEAAPRLPHLVESFDTELAALKAHLRTAEDTLEAAFRARLIREQAYWQAKGEMQRRALDLEAQDLQRQMAEQQRLIDALSKARPKDANQRQEIEERLQQAKNRLAELQIKMGELDGRRMVVDLEVRSNLDRARQELEDMKASLRERIAEATGAMTPEMRRAAIERANRDLLEKMAGDAEGMELARRMIDVEAAKAEMGDLESAWRLALETMRNAETSANIQREQGLITTAEAQARIAEAHRQAAAELDALLPKMDAVARVLGPEAAARVAAFRNELMQVGQVVDPIAASLSTTFKDAFATMFEQIGSGAKTAKEAFLDFARSVIAAIQRILAQRLAEQLFGAMGGGGGGLGAVVSGVFKMLGFARGGYVTGPGTSTSDSIPARLSAGEYVIRAEAVRRVGVAFLDAINGLRLPPAWNAGRLAFAAGGMVPAVVQPAQQQQSIRIVNAIDPGVTYDHLQTPAGERVILNIIGRNASAVRAALA